MSTAAKPLLVETLTREAFAPFGDVITRDGTRHHTINRGMAEKYPNLAVSA